MEAGAEDTRELPKFISPILDLTFEKVFQEKDLLKSLIEAVLDITIESIEVIPTTPIPVAVKENIDKMAIFDVECKDKQGKQYEIQMQRTVQQAIQKRTTFYGSRLYCSQLKKDASYETLNKTIVIAILDFKHFENDEDVLRCFKITDEIHKDHMNTLEWYYIELPKFKFVGSQIDSLPNQDKLNSWLDFLKNADKKTEIPANVPNEVARAYALIERSSFTQEQQKEIRKRMGLLNLFEKQEIELEKKDMELQKKEMELQKKETELKELKEMKELRGLLTQSLLKKKSATQDLSEEEINLGKKLKLPGF